MTAHGTTIAPSAVTEAACFAQAGQKCPGDSAVYGTDPVWIALNFGLADPHYYVPRYTSGGTGTTSTFIASAQGNLDGDANYSLFERRGWVNASNDVYAAGGIYIVNEIE